MSEGKKKSFVRRHIVGWILSVLTFIVGITTSALYSVFQVPVEANIAAGQAQNSMTNWILIHQMQDHNLVLITIAVATLGFILLFLLPTIIEIIKASLSGKELE